MSYYELIYDFITKLGKDVAKIKQERRIAFSSISRTTHKMLRLAWLENKPVDNNKFQIWLRDKNIGSEYPKLYIDKYWSDGWEGKYLTTIIETEDDLLIAMRLIEFAYQNK